MPRLTIVTNPALGERSVTIPIPPETVVSIVWRRDDPADISVVDLDPTPSLDRLAVETAAAVAVLRSAAYRIPPSDPDRQIVYQAAARLARWMRDLDDAATDDLPLDDAASPLAN